MFRWEKPTAEVSMNAWLLNGCSIGGSTNIIIVMVAQTSEFYGCQASTRPLLKAVLCAVHVCTHRGIPRAISTGRMPIIVVKAIDRLNKLSFTKPKS